MMTSCCGKPQSTSASSDARSRSDGADVLVRRLVRKGAVPGRIREPWTSILRCSTFWTVCVRFPVQPMRFRCCATVKTALGRHRRTFIMEAPTNTAAAFHSSLLQSVGTHGPRALPQTSCTHGVHILDEQRGMKMSKIHSANTIRARKIATVMAPIFCALLGGFRTDYTRTADRAGNP